MDNRMYIKQLIDKNVGPLSEVRIDFPFFENGNPKPVVLVGENGTGKSTVLSNIVDAFFEMAGEAYTNARVPSGQNGYQYYKILSAAEIHHGTSFMFSYISFLNSKNSKYIFKHGNIAVDEFKRAIDDDTVAVSWKYDESKKQVTADIETISQIWDNNVFCYFGPDRYEKPSWMGDRYYQTEEYLHPSLNESWKGVLKNPIIVQDVTSTNLQWLLDVIADSRADIAVDGSSLRLDHTSAPNLLLLRQSRNNLEMILSKILGEEVYFQLNYRNSGGSRFRIVKNCDNTTVCPTLDSLSTGQIALFNLFATIIRYADNNNINQSFHPNEITGIVVIDEIELHLHSILQKEVLPELIKLFPKIQFIITSHAPLFLLGMKDCFGEDGFCMYEMPSAEKITTEKFSEFRRAYEYIKGTEMFQDDVNKAIEALPLGEKAIIVTEGSTDWKHLKAAYESLKNSDSLCGLFEDLDIEFFEYEPLGSEEPAEHKLNMGNKVLVELCESVAKLPQPVKYIFICDRDVESTNKRMSVDGQRFKKWGNNVYSFVLPIPPHRVDTPDICIEHYYTDDEIRIEWYDPKTGITRRLFIGKEFDKRGIAKEIDRFCEKGSKCGSSSIAIIDGSSGERVTSISDDNDINYALPKSKFAKMILEKQPPFDNINFENFVGVFEVIRDILNDDRGGENV